ncbi:MAG: protoporphyrinogen oxidase, partial [Candidatus Rokubacteria bacterium]|nr:protoporphyrinogen oxidase [Candidatus Rokubacteria bacterium]
GGGIAGLAAAHRLTELARERGLGLSLTLLEARDRLGGTIATERAGGFLIEAGPDSFLTDKPWGLALVERLGLGERLIGTREGSRRVFVVHRGRLHPLPEGFLLLAPTRLGPLLRSRLFSWPGKLRMALDLVLPRGRETADESLASFVRRRLGREALERVAQPLVAGIYTADPESLSLAATMPRFLELERRHRSLILGLRAEAARRAGAASASGVRYGLFASLAGGMGELVEALAGRLADAVRLKSPVAGLSRSDRPPRWRIYLADGGTLEADGVMLATEAHAAARIAADLDPELARDLAGIPYASSATVTLGYRREAIAHPLDGFGVVVPRSERRPIIACTFSSLKYPGRAPEGHVLLRAFLGGALQEGMLALDDEALAATARAELAALLGITGPPELVRVHRHPAAMPQYRVGHLELVAGIEARLARHPGLALAGSAYRGVGLADTIHSAETAASHLLLAPGSGHDFH